MTTPLEAIAEEIQNIRKMLRSIYNIPIDYVIIKKTTGDPTGREGLRVINTVDNTYKIYADGAWRTIVSW